MEFNISFRFGVIQTDKLRDCDDLERSTTNLAYTVETPTHLVSLGDIPKLSILLDSKSGDWVMCKSDRNAAYKQLPIDPDYQATAIAALRHPSEGMRYGFVTRTQILGSAAAVLPYNELSRI